MSLKELAEALPDYARDIRLNVGSLLADAALSDQRKYGLLLACAHGSGHRPLVEAAETEVEGRLSPEAANAARAAAAVMAMNNVYYRFVHLSSNKEYATLPARLRMNVIGSPGIEELRWVRPVRVDDVISFRCEVAERKESRSKPDMGLVRFSTTVTNQSGEIVMTQDNWVMFSRRDDAR